MQLTLVEAGSISCFSLPEKASGQHWITRADADGRLTQLLAVEAVDGSWVLRSNKSASVSDSKGGLLHEAALEPNHFYNISLLKSDERLVLRSEPTSDDRRRFTKYVLPTKGTLTIGRAEGSDIRFASRLVSSKHADLILGDDGLRVVDAGSANGTFVNCKRVTDQGLSPGDAVSILGMSIIVGRGFIAINNPDGLVACNEAVLKPMAVQPPEEPDEEIEEASPGVTFFRSPRFKRDIVRNVVKIDSPPKTNVGDEQPIMMTVGPALTMGMASLFMGFFAVTSVISQHGNIMTAMPTLVMSLTMMVGMILWPILSQRHQKRTKARKEVERHEKYRVYLDKTKERIGTYRAEQTDILLSNITPLDDCIKRIRQRQRNLWERTAAHDDFLRVRLGVGDWPFDADMQYGEKKFSVDEDDLEDEMYELVEESKQPLPEVPVSVSLRSQPIIGFIGDRECSREQVRSIIFQLAALHSYDELKLVFLVDPSEYDAWEFVKWLPHVWSDDRTTRFVATSSAEAKELSAYLDRELESRLAATGGGDHHVLTPHYVVFALDKELADRTEFFCRILKERRESGFSLVTTFDKLRNLPKECRVVIETEGEVYRLYDKDDTTGAHLAFRPDAKLNEDASELARCLANTELDTAAGAFALPSMLTFLEMFGVGKVEHLNALDRWRENNPVDSLETPIGLLTSGEQFKLDIHERFHGPHGLIAGMTGSGKSELIMSYILSLAVNYHPHELAFVLIDYKGGGMANAFADLPHVAGTITNLDGTAVNRSLISLQSELRRRQAIFNDASERTGVSSIDIYRYQSLYREGAVTEPLAHLVVISDEFAELKSQQPEFMTQLVSAARIGRSLGVHLILATQKPSGVVNEQIWSNTRFRVCLKVQETADSMEVIKRPDAASLAATGRFYVQVGFNELFELGQSAWAGAPYYPAERVEKAYDYSVALVNTVGRPVKQMRMDKRKSMFARPSKQVDEVTKYLKGVADHEGVAARPLWLDPIPEIIYLSDIKPTEVAADSHVLNPVVGLYDDPTQQQQGPMTVPLSDQGNVIVYGSAGSGKSTFLTTLLFSLIVGRRPDELSLYVLDFASETLRAFTAAPHVGDVLFSSDAEKIENLFKMLTDEMSHRRGLFANFGGDYASYIAQSGQPLESVVVAINNYSGFIESFPDAEESVSLLAREGTRYGIYFVLTASGPGAVRYRTAQSFKQLYVMQMNDLADYAGILGSTQGVLPAELKGRGIFRSDSVYEFQTAHVTSQPQGDLAFIREWSAKQAQQWEGVPARKIPTLPNVVSATFMADELGRSPKGSVPVGIDKETLQPIFLDVEKPFITQVLSQHGETDKFVQGMAELLAMDESLSVLVLDAANSFRPDDDRKYELIGDDAQQLALSVEGLARALEEARVAGESVGTFDRTICVVPSLSSLLGRIPADLRMRFTEALAGSDSSAHVTFVFADRATNDYSSLLFEPWAKAHLNTGSGVWVGDGISDQFALRPTKSSSDLYQPIGEDFGYLLRRGKQRLVKLVVSDLIGSEEQSDE